MVARLLTETTPATDQFGEDQTWPRVTKQVDDDAAWQEAIDAGAITEEQAAVDRADGVYTGWRLSIQSRMDPPQMVWTEFYEGDATWCSRAEAEADPECA
jgi:hypothetical protein